MKSALKPGSCVLPSDSVERILSRYYPQLVEWSRILARGDESTAEEIVQDLCLHFTVAQPDLSRVKNLYNYLFMCLRNMYVSSLARVSRERLRVIQIEDFDALGGLAANGGLDTLHVQNELIRISNYVAGRKSVSKSASHFILHFFLGYRRKDVARLARLPISAVYNGLKETRAELREALSAGEKIRLVPQDAAAEQELLRAPLPSDLLLQQLRSTILDADPASCIAEKELVDSYKQSVATPVACRELAHLAGCERCLSIVERALQLDDRDGPFDGIGASLDRKPEGAKSFDATMRIVSRRREQLLERRPGLLAIAVDGRVAAFHAIESAHNSLSSRVDAFAAVHFVEVFDEFGDRLAHIPLDPESQDIPREQLSQQVLLSDNRLLRLDVRFDGLGIHAEVDYFDPALVPSAEPENPLQARKPLLFFWKNFRGPQALRVAPWGVVAFASLVLFAVLAIAGYQYTHPAWDDVLARAQAVAQVPSPAEALHQTLRVEQITGSQQPSILGSIDIWRNSDKETVRRLYNAQQQLLATAIDSVDGRSSVRLENNTASAQTDRMLVESGVWRSDVSPAGFDIHQRAEASRGLSGFELTQREEERDGIFMRTLVLDRNYHVEAERLRFRTAEGVVEVRLVQTLLRTVPNRDVPPLTFPQTRDTTPSFPDERNLSPQSSSSAVMDSSSASLEVAVLFQLFQRNVDIGQPIEVSAIAGGRVRMTGTLSDAGLVAAIRESIATLPDAGRVDFQIYSAREATSAAHRGKTLRQELTGTTSDAPATELVRNALLARGLKGTDLQSAEQEFMESALAHAQTALQHAYALDRLGAILRLGDTSSLTRDARNKWAQMVDQHSAATVTELKILRLQLDSLSPAIPEIPSGEASGISDTPAFTRTSFDLLEKAQSINKEVVNLFAGSAIALSAEQTRQSIAHLRADLPLDEANRMHLFASRLTNQHQDEVGEMHHR